MNDLNRMNGKFLSPHSFLSSVVGEGEEKGKGYRLVPLLLGMVLLSSLSFGWGSSNNPTISIEASKSVTEGNSGTTSVSLTITASDCPDTSDIKIHWNTADGSATTSNNDYKAAEGDVTFPVSWWCSDSDKSKTVSVDVVGDTKVENNETFTVNISDGGTDSSQNFTIGNATGTVTIVNDDQPQPPVAKDVTVKTYTDTPVPVHLDATDPNGDDITSYPIQSGPEHGQLSGAEPDITYTPENGFVGTDTFTYQACASDGCSNTATVTIVVKAPPVHVDHPSICMESLTYGKKDGLGSACFNADGVFTGGTGCIQILKLRNLSDTAVTRSDIDVDYSNFVGELDNTCGIDGTDQTGADCNVSSSPEEALFNPVGSFDKYKAHTVYLGVISAEGNSSPFDGPITVNYEQNGTEYTGTLEKCQVATEPANDLCYDPPVEFDGLMCFSMGDFFGGGMGCKTTIHFRNQGDETLYNPIVNVITDSMFEGHMMDDCGIDGTSGNCSDSDVLSGPFMGMSGLGMARTLTYDPMPDFDANDTHSTYSSSFMSMKLFSNTTLLGTYVKNGQLYRGEIKACGGNDTGFDAEGSMDAVDKYDADQYERGKGLQTKVAKKDVTADLVYLGENLTPKTNEAADIPVYLYLLDDNCEQPLLLSDEPMATIEKNSESATSDDFRFDRVTRANRLGMRYVDYDRMVREGGPECLKNSSTGQNAVPGMPACVASDTQYTEAFGEEAYQRCKVDNGQPCDPSHHGYGDAPYDNEYGCYQCTMDVVGSRVCSSDDFAIRPDRFVIGMPDPDYPNLLRSGKDYNISLTAYSVDGNVSSDYNVSNLGTWLDVNQSRYFRDGSLATGSQLQGILEINVSTSINAVGGKSTDTSSEPASAEAVIPLSYDDVGKIKALIFDKEWASVDNDDTPMDCNDSHAHTYICGEQNLTFIPDHFQVANIKVHNHNDGKVTYLSDDLNMSAHLDVNISARNAKDKITRNFRQGALYYENPMTITLSVTDWNSSLSNPHPLGYHAITQGIASPTRLGFGGADANGTHFIHWNDANQSQRLMFNYPRKKNEPVNPFDVNGTEIQVNVASAYTDASSGSNATIAGSGVGGTDSHATFAYARATPSMFFYDDVNTSSVKTPISIEIYKNPITSSYDLNLSVFRPTAEFDWYLATPHNPNNGDGNVTLSADANGTVSPATIQPVNGMDPNVTVTNTGTPPDIVDVNLSAATSSWLIYNRDKDSVPTPFYRVRFVGTGGWTGHGKTGHVVGAKANTRKERRIEW